MANPRQEYHWEYYRRNRAKRLEYQRKYDADTTHKAAKAKRMKRYKQCKRHGFHAAVFSGFMGAPVLSEEERERRFRDRQHVLNKDANYRCAKFHREWVKEHSEEAAKAEAQYWRYLELMRTWDWERQGMPPGVQDC